MSPRQSLWIALSNLYLDTEMQAFTHRYIARVIHEGGFSLAEVWHIDKYEVFPVLFENLLIVAGVWGAFEEHSLIRDIEQAKGRLTGFRRLRIRVLFRIFGGMQQHDRDQIEIAYRELQAPSRR